jgi:DNA-binding NarL/FixJ family response regulator
MSITPLRLVVVDDHSLFRRGLISLLVDMPEFQVVGEAGMDRKRSQSLLIYNLILYCLI